ncbi:MAG: response regulator [Lachnospiraceae bacterium]|nr:response regulator [Lachnospiraceae bacterium]
MSDNSVLIISVKETFSVHGMESKLAEIGYEATYVPTDIEALTARENGCKLLVYYMDEKSPIDPRFIVYLKDLCVEKDKSLILVGRKEEYETVLRTMPQNCITEWFERPLDMNRFLEAVKQQFDNRMAMAMRKTILIVDDDVTYMQMIREWLKDTYTVVMVNSGMKAIQWLTTNKADLVLLDYEMPVVNGPTIFEMLKSDTDSDVVPVMFLTGQSSQSSVLTAMKLRPVDYLLKKITRNELRDKLQLYFARQKANG